MFIKKLSTVLFLSAILLTIANAQTAVPADSSEITSAIMPGGAKRFSPGNIPAEVDEFFDEILRQSVGKMVGGSREVLAWSRRNKSLVNAARLKGNFQSAGWEFESHGKQGEVEAFNLIKEGSPRRVIMGYFFPLKDELVCALLEVKATGAKPTTGRPQNEYEPSNPSSAKVVTVDKNTNWINVMGSEMPPMPSFPTLQPKPGKVRGYVKDWSRKPLSGAEIGVRSSYFAGYYSGGQGKTDANGYYELTPPKGSAEIYNAGYQIQYGDGVAAVSLHPADGKLDSFVTSDGAVENFVLLPYGITSREKLQDSSHLPSTFYGGAIILNWYGVEANDGNAPPFAVREGSLLETTLTPEGKMLDGSIGQTIVIRKTLGASGGFRIHNIPLGRYRISIKANGKSLKIKDNSPPQIFGMKPVETTGQASILFVPDTAKASMVTPQHGAWKWIDLRIETP